MPAYASEADMVANVEGWVTDNAGALARLLERASRDVDSVLGPRAVLRTGPFVGFKLNPAALDAVDAAALARATCEQAAYRLRRAPDGGAPLRRTKRIKGPDFEQEYADAEAAGTGRISPDLPALLEPIRHLRMLTARTVA